uniref:VWFA domain-containing protein n=1 Tax=Steinernema glaseri TaxID=37863 RepID=A0A1I7ZIB7_9BILA
MGFCSMYLGGSKFLRISSSSSFSLRPHSGGGRAVPRDSLGEGFEGIYKCSVKEAAQILIIVDSGACS